VSHNSKKDLSKYLLNPPVTSEVVHNGLNFNFEPLPRPVALNELSNVLAAIPDQGMLVHVGGNVWYKNRKGVVHIYSEYCKQCDDPLPLWMVGDAPSPGLRALAKTVEGKGKIYFLSGLSNKQVQAIYSLAKALIFPSLAEGFGWPIAEAMACGCPVLTTDQAPMTEVGGDSVTYIPRMPHEEGVQAWAHSAANSLIALLDAPEQNKLMRRSAGLEQVSLFNTDKAISAYEEIYHRVMAQYRPSL
jgi:glycosyltransferase involved in cell wall biosynthesis